MIPVHIDALYLGISSPAVDATANFTKLPYHFTQEKRDVNSDMPWLGESVVSSPFENSNLTLQAGVHLHWALPDGLCHGEVVNGKLEMPVVPNRWMIRRRPVGSEREKIWVVESDYLWPPTNQAPAVNIFHKTSDEGRPYRFMGRKLTWEEWEEQRKEQVKNNNSHEYLEKLTAFGYGETTFAAYYPNCMTVFGFHDSNPIVSVRRKALEEELEKEQLPNIDQLIHKGWLVKQSPPSDYLNLVRSNRQELGNQESEARVDALLQKLTFPLQYDLLGWYAGGTSHLQLSWDKSVKRKTLEEELQNKNLPDISQLITKGWLIEQSPPSNHLEIGVQNSRQKLNNPILEAQVDTLFKRITLIKPSQYWRVDGNEKPETLMCYASIQIAKGSVDQTSKDSEPTKIAVGNTVSEALSALLANEVANEMPEEKLKDPSLVSKIEEQLEALHIDAQLASEVQDVGLRLRRYRHEKSFEPVSGGESWTIHADPPGIESLPEDVLTALRNLNDAQAQYDKQKSELEQARKQLYGDWCQYMRCIYRPLDSGRGEFLDIDEVKNYIETRSLARVEYLSGIVKNTRNQLEITKAKLEGQITQLNQQIKQEAETQKAEKSETCLCPTQYSLQLEPGARFWQLTEPVVLITGSNVQVSDRHGRDGRNAADGMLQCETYNLDKTTPEDEFSDVLEWINEQWARYPPGDDGNSDSCIGFRIVNAKERPWNPLFLDWGIDMNPAESHAPGVLGGYDSDIITSNYQLGSQNPDLQPASNSYFRDNPDRLSGRCILGDTPALILRERIEEVLQRCLIEGKPEFWANAQDTDYFETIKSWYRNQPTNLPTTPAQLDALFKWYEDRPLLMVDVERNSDPLYITLLAYKKLFDNVNIKSESNNKLRLRAFWGQALSGFNGELIQWKLGLSLPIDEPIGLTPYREFSQRVANAVGDYNEWATEPTNNFSPIRSGILKLDKLRLIDNFGQVSDIPCDDKVIVPTPYKKGQAGDIFLPPRLVQPARVMFRWLDVENAVSQEKLNQADDMQRSPQMVEAEGRSPICGWLLPEKLRGRLLVFAGGGSPLGALAADKNSKTLEWVRAPGFSRFSDDECEAGRKWLESVSKRYYDSVIQELNDEARRDLGELGANLQNRRLARVLLYLWATRSPQFLENFLNTLDDAMANIDPEGTTSMGSLALLVGRPVAVVGAELDLQLKDEPAVRQDWDAFRTDLYRYQRDTDEFEQVQFRLRLGQYQSRNDGVVGYWLEESDGFAKNTFVAQAADDNDPSRRLELKDGEIPEGGLKAKINAHDRGDQVDDLNFTQSVASPSLQVTLLMDPRGKAHLTTGILPVKSIDIPRPLWEPALEAMQLWFPVAPILTRSQSRRVPIPTLVDRQWSWLEQVKTDETPVWQTLYPRPSVDRNALYQELWRLNAELGRVALADYDLILRGPQSKNAIPTSGKSLIVARKLKDREQYLISIFDGAGHQVITDKVFTDDGLVNQLNNKLTLPNLVDHQGRELTQRILMTVYDLILKRTESTEDSLSLERKNLVIVRQTNNNDNTNYIVSIFDGAEQPVINNQKITKLELVSELEEALQNNNLSNEKKLELLLKIASNLGYGQSELIVRRSQDINPVPSQGKNLVIATRGNEPNHYLITMFNVAGQQIVIDQNLTDVYLITELDTVRDLRELGRDITSNLGYTYFEIEHLIEKKWLEEIEPISDRLYVNTKEERQPLDDWALETLLEQRLAELSLALVSPGEDIDFNPGIEVREGWLMLQSSDRDKKT
jgi:hypothetical protein